MTHDFATTRRDFLTAAASTAVAVGSTSGIASSAAGARGVPLLEQVDRGASWSGVRFDGERSALLLLGEPGSFATEGTYTSAPVALSPGVRWSLTWRPRWTTPIEWERFGANPLLVPTPGGWDDSQISTCSVIELDGALTMFYGARNRGIGVAVCEGKDPGRWRKLAGRAVLGAGAPGAFDAGGVLGPKVIRASSSTLYMYYVGYNPKRHNGPVMAHQIGLAKSTDNGRSWERVSTRPVIPYGPAGSCDGATVSSNCVLRVGKRWYAWYTGISQFPYLASVCLASSADGVSWEKYPHNPVLGYNPYVATDAFLVASPWVLHEEGVYKMWYNSKGFGDRTSPGEYHIGYAESLDGIHWERCPILPVLGPSGRGWDSQMVEYPAVANLGGQYYMWYSGDAYSTIGGAQGRPITSVRVESRTGESRVPDPGWNAWQAHTQPTASVLREMRGNVQVRLSLRTADRRISPMIQQLSIEPERRT
jgi:predicted GH43/DUF377 family glycosyl hydrolase